MRITRPLPMAPAEHSRAPDAGVLGDHLEEGEDVPVAQAPVRLGRDLEETERDPGRVDAELEGLDGRWNFSFLSLALVLEWGPPRWQEPTVTPLAGG